MKEQQDRIIAYVLGISSEDERQRFESELQQSKELQEGLKAVREAWPRSKQIAKAQQIEARKEDAWRAIQGKTTHKVRTISLGTVAYRVAAAVLALIALGTVIYMNMAQPDATYMAGVERVTVTLPDESQVILGEGSMLTFKQKANGERVAELKGLAHFSVKHDEEHPFVVKAGDGCVRVLGTKFTVENIAERNRVHVEVEDGLVRFDADGQSELLSAQHYATLTDDAMVCGEHSVGKVDWASQTLVFKGAKLESIVEDLMAVYPEIKGVRGECNDDSTLVSTIFSHQPLGEVIDELNIHFDEKIALDNGFLVISD